MTVTPAPATLEGVSAVPEPAVGPAPGFDTELAPDHDAAPDTDSGLDPALDGRLARSVRTRTAVIDALLALHEDGELSPTALRVAARAGVALRTVYGHFADMEALYAESGEREIAKLASVAIPVPTDLPYVDRVDAFAAGRARVLEWLLPVMRAAALREHTSPSLLANRQRFVARGDAEVRQVFGRELSVLSAAQCSDVLDAIHQVAGGPAWLALRVDRDLSPEQAATLLARTLTPVLEALLHP